MAQSFYVTDITIGRGPQPQNPDPGNVISCDNMGNMVFRDRFIGGGATLTQLLNGGGGSGSGGTSITTEVAVSEWAVERSDPVYNRTFWSVSLYFSLIGFAMENLDPKKVRATAQLIITTSPLVTEEIEFDDVLVYSDHIKIVSSSPVRCYVTIEST